MVCPKNNKHCSQKQIILMGGDYTCMGMNSKSKRYKHDIVKFCLSGKYAKCSIEMTLDEAEYFLKLLKFVISPTTKK